MKGKTAMAAESQGKEELKKRTEILQRIISYKKKEVKTKTRELERLEKSYNEYMKELKG